LMAASRGDCALSCMKSATTKRERVERYLWLREPRTRERVRPKFADGTGWWRPPVSLL
jgi:hypothetical protein